MLKSIIAAVLVGVLAGLWLALAGESIEIFRNYVEGVWRYQVGVRSFAAPVVGAVIGALAGANIQLALSQERADGFVLGTTVGAGIGIILALAQIALVALAALLQVYDVEYGFLLTRFVGILSAAMLIGSIAGLLGLGHPLGRPVATGAVIGALTSVAFVLPVPLSAAFDLTLSTWTSAVGGAIALTAFVLTYHLPVLFAGIGSGAIVGAVQMRKADGSVVDAQVGVGMALGAIAAVTTSSLSFHYVILGLESSASSFSVAMVAFRTLVGLLFGCAVGLFATYAMRRFLASRGTAAGMTLPTD